MGAPHRVQRVSLAAVLFAAVLFTAMAVPADLLDPPLELTLDNGFPDLGDAMTFSITGPPGTEFSIRGSATPSETFLPNWGRIFIGTDSLLTIGSGVLDGNGEGSVSINVPNNPNLLDRLFYFQVRGELAPDQGVSNAVVARMQSTPPSGARQPAAMAVTPDGTKVYVAHEKDATLSVIDTASDSVIVDMPIGPMPKSLGKPIVVAIDPDGRHAFVVNPQVRQITVVHVESDSIAGQLAVPQSSNGIAFDFSGPEKLVYVTNTRDRAVLVFDEVSAGNFTPLPSIPVEGHGPGPIARLADGTLAVANRQSLDVEFLDPEAAPGSTTLARTVLSGGLPLDLIERDGELLVPIFSPASFPLKFDGANEVLEIDLTTFETTGSTHWRDLATDYLDGDASSQFVAIAGSGSGSVLVADRATLALEELVEIAPGEPTTHTVQVAFLPDLGSGERIYALNHFRETIRPIELSGGPPFSLGAEIAMAHSGQPRVPLSDLSNLENGDWFFSTVEFFNGTATNPNLVTCNTCHTWYFSGGFSNNAEEPLHAQVLFELGETGPWLHNGNIDDLQQKSRVLFNNHGTVGGELTPAAELGMTLFQQSGIRRTASPFLAADGSMSPDALAGKAIFEGAAECSSCHVEPLFIPLDPDDLTIDTPGGVGTGIDRINVTTLLGLWSSAPYLHDGSAATLLDVLLLDTNDRHGETSLLTATERAQLVAYLQSL